MKFQIKSRWDSNKVLFEAELDAAYEKEPYSLQLGAAVRLAVKSGADLSGSDLSGSNLSGSDLRYSNLSGSNLSGSDLSGSNLRGSNLSGSDLRYSNLSGSNLSGSDLSGSNLSGSDLSGSNLRYSNLSGSNLRGSNLRYSDLRGSNLSGSTWRDGVKISRAPIQIYGLTWAVTILDDHMQIGCKFHSLDDWREFDDARIVEMDGKNALKFWRAHKDFLLGIAAADGRGVKKEEAA